MDRLPQVQWILNRQGGEQVAVVVVQDRVVVGLSGLHTTGRIKGVHIIGVLQDQLRGVRGWGVGAEKESGEVGNKEVSLLLCKIGLLLVGLLGMEHGSGLLWRGYGQRRVNPWTWL